ncbi:MAG: hypothetical protein IT222_08740 [Crocinitomix sp.]|nr:hypothetical protein [Crocinitomix sp.]
MKKLSLLFFGLCFAFVGLQSFMNDEVITSDKTELNVANENWSPMDVDGTDGTKGVASDWGWRITPCVTKSGIPGTKCAYVNVSGITCPASNTKFTLCNANM